VIGYRARGRGIDDAGGDGNAAYGMNKPDPRAAISPNRADDAPYVFSPAILPGIVRGLDIVMIMIAAAISYTFLAGRYEYFDEYYTFSTIFVGFIFLVLANRADLYDVNAIMRPLKRADDIMVAVITAFLLLLSMAFSLKVSESFSRLWMFGFAGGGIVTLVAGRLAVCGLLKRLSRRHMVGRNLVVLGTGAQAQRFLRRFSGINPYFARIVGVYADRDAPTAGAWADACDEGLRGVPLLGGLDALLRAARAGKIDDVVVALPWNADKEVAQAIERLKELPVNVYLSSDLVGFELAFRPVLGAFSDLPMFEVVQRPISGWSSALKALEDYVLATLILIVISPLLLAIAVAIKLDTPGPVFFMQRRLGFNNKEFLIYKFRSMHHRKQPETTVRQATKGDPRVTRVGRLIRATSLDELPQVLNVLNGTMSLVGPRPHALSHNEEYGRQIRGYFARHRVKPGITGWAQVNGLRGETEALEKMTARIEHDVYYAENWSLLFDLRILILTAIVVFFQKSAY